MRNINEEDEQGKTKQTDEEISWIARLKRSKVGIYPSPHNVNLIMENDNFFRNIYWFNDMTRTPEVLNNGKFRDMKDGDITDACVYLTEFWMNNLKPETVKSVILSHCERKKRHPLRNDYLDKLVWDGIERLPTWMPVYLGTEYSDYTKVVGCMSIIALVARVYQPGCKYDYVVVLEGEQGIGKSTALRILGGEYFSDSMPPINNKDVKAHVCKWWLIEISEFHTLTKAEDAEQKHFISKQEEAYRPVYGRFEVVHKRQCTIWATINLDTYLRDETGNRRFWPVKCNAIANGKLDTEGLERDRDQLFAEAVQRFRQGWAWYPTREFEEKHMKKEQEARLVYDPWQPTIVNNWKAAPADCYKAVNTTQVYQNILGQGPQALPTLQEALRIGKILRNLKCPFRRGKHGMLYDLTVLAKEKADE